MLKKDNTAFLTSDNKNFIKMNQQEFLTNTYANLSKENDTISGNVSKLRVIQYILIALTPDNILMN